LVFLVIIFATNFWACQSEHLVCAFKSRKDKGPWQVAGLTETASRLPSDSISLNEVCTTTSLIWVKPWIEIYETWLLVYLFALYTFSLLPDPASKCPSSPNPKSESIWISFSHLPFVPLLRFTTFDLESPHQLWFHW